MQNYFDKRKWNSFVEPRRKIDFYLGVALAYLFFLLRLKINEKRLVIYFLFAVL